MADTDHIKRVYQAAELIYSQQEVEQAFDVMAADISRALADRNPLLLCVMSGGLIPASELFTRMNFPAQLDYLHVSRYHGSTRGSELQWIARPRHALEGRTVLVVDDILDEGLTLAAILAYCREQGAAAVYSAVMVEKLHARKAGELRADFTGLQVEDRYVFGYGMDYHGYLRNVKAIYAVEGDHE